MDLATAALAKLKAARLPDEDGSQKQKIVNESPKKSVKPKGKERVATSSSSSSNNRAARRQEERRRQRAQRERLEEDQDDEKRDEDIMPQSLDSFGFLPHDYPLSDTDTETVNPVKERKKRVLRSRKVSVCAARRSSRRPSNADFCPRIASAQGPPLESH